MVIILLALGAYLVWANNLGYHCGSYERDFRLTKKCAVCGNFLCAEYEKCVPLSIAGNTTSDDCGPLYCPLDCR